MFCLGNPLDRDFSDDDRRLRVLVNFSMELRNEENYENSPIAINRGDESSVRLSSRTRFQGNKTTRLFIAIFIGTSAGMYFENQNFNIYS